jgi:hypothetical protein
MLNKFSKLAQDPEVMSIYPLIGIMGLSLSLVGYSSYRHLWYDSDYFLSYRKRNDSKNITEYGMKTHEEDGKLHQEEIEWTYNKVNSMKHNFPWNLIFNNVKD